MIPDTTAEILLVDRDPALGREVVAYLAAQRYTVEWVDDSEKAYNCLESRPFDVLVTEFDRRHLNGMRLMGVAKARNPEVCVILISRDPDLALATEAIRQGAYDFHTKPLNMAKLEAVIQRGIRFQQLLHQQHELRRRLDQHYGLGRMIGRSRGILQAYTTVRQAASSSVPIIIIGEPGTGKDLIAQTVHNNSARRDGPFVMLDCAAGGPAMIRRELFGTAAASDSHPGRAELADGGTLYLHHAEALQKQFYEPLLAALRERRVWRAEATKPLRVDFRLIIAASPQSTASAVTRGLMTPLTERHDAVTIELPPLRERRDDIPLLAEAFLDDAATSRNKPIKGIDRVALDVMMQYSWPGNVSELRDAIDRMLLGAKEDSYLYAKDVPESIRAAALPRPGEIRIPPGSTLEQAERLIIEETLKSCGYRKQECASRLGIGLRTLYRKLDDYESV